jgi:hypothetical protein
MLLSNLFVSSVNSYKSPLFFHCPPDKSLKLIEGPVINCRHMDTASMVFRVWLHWYFLPDYIASNPEHPHCPAAFEIALHKMLLPFFPAVKHAGTSAALQFEYPVYQKCRVPGKSCRAPGRASSIPCHTHCRFGTSYARMEV